MRKNLSPVLLAATLAAAGVACAHAAEKELPTGPIRDRHELMEGIGKNAKVIGDALKSSKHDPIADAAKSIQADSAKVLALFPKDSTHPNSRAKDEIWTDWAKFEKINDDMGVKAGELATAATTGGNVGKAADAMFGTCKGCHDDFRKPEEKKP
jgi:cytochrome c556